MVKLMVFLRRRHDVSEEAFDHHYQHTHLPLVARMPGLRRLVLNRVQSDPAVNPSEWDMVVEDYFDTPEAMQAALASPEGQAVYADAPNILDMSKLQFLVVQEEDVPLGTDRQVASGRSTPS